MSVRDSRIEMRLLVVGEKAVGKTELTTVYTSSNLSKIISKRKDDTFMYNTVINGNQVAQQILDSNVKNSAILAWAHGIVSMYSIDNLESFNKALERIDQIKELNVKQASFMLVGNKTDLPNREVPTDVAQKEAEGRGCHFRELSVQKDPEAVAAMFEVLSKEIFQCRGLGTKNKTPTLVRKIFKSLGRSKPDPELDGEKLTFL